MIRSFRNQGTEDIFNGRDSKAARKVIDTQYQPLARIHLVMLNAATTLEDLRSPGNQVERLKKDRTGQRGLRINKQYRVCFVWSDGDAEQVEVTDYH